MPRSGHARAAAALIGWVALSVVVPGAAHLRAGWRRTGVTLMGAYLAILTGLIAVAATADADFAGRVLNWLIEITIGSLILALAWFLLVIHSFVVLQPGRLSRAGQIVTGVSAGVLSIAVALPFAVAAQYVAVSEATIEQVFTESASASVPVSPSRDPWAGRDRINVLLLGGDWGRGRKGVRTDSINVASVDVHTGDTVLLGLPRNLEHVRFPPGSPMAARFPNGFELPEYRPGWREDLLFSVWQYAEDHPELFGGRAHMGAQTLKETVGYILGLRVDWYALVNIWGFAKIIDALGGLVLTVDRDIVFGKYDEGLIKAGTRKLDGGDTLWYARSRTYSDDFNRMHRQLCVLRAMLDQADPATVLARFNQLAQVTRNIVHTDIPRDMLEHLVPLALKVKAAKVTSLQFVPPLINTASPDWTAIRQLTAHAIHASAAGSEPPHPSKTTASSPARLGEGCGAL